ncbi:MAG TPA: hypothetical protein VNW99_08180 [Cytophagaceae bacterium]|jgi:hypothetical protein|nr:hypothetical protein [Cytophagaceae bacterium]
MNRNLIILTLFAVAFASSVYAQDDKVKFSAVGRALEQNSKLNATDTINAHRNNAGHALIDLGININPDKKTEILAVMRLRSDLSGFFGAGNTAFLRWLSIKGIIGKGIAYQVGDIHLKLSPYTLFNNYAEGSVNEAAIFSNLRRDYSYYENFNKGNYWWQQGAHTNFTFAFKSPVMEKIRIDAFVLRNRAANSIFGGPTALHAGGRMEISQSRFLNLTANYINLYEVGATTSSDSSARNPVGSIELNSKLVDNAGLGINLFGETGFSQLNFDKYPSKPTNAKGTFFDGGLGATLKSIGLSIKGSYRYVSADFYSSGAQSKRVNFNNNPALFRTYGDNPFAPNTRGITIFDLVRDPNIYNTHISYQLQAYDPRLANTMPYGKATPNRKGLVLETVWKDSLEKAHLHVTGALLSEVNPINSTNFRKFTFMRAALDLNVHQWIGFKKRIILNGGMQYEHTTRSGTSSESVDLKSILVDAGAEIEIFKKLDVLYGMKMLNSKGNEYLTVRNNFNAISSVPTPFITNGIQNMMAFGLKYRFSPNSYLTLQDHIFNYKDKSNDSLNYSINQVVMMFFLNY